MDYPWEEVVVTKIPVFKDHKVILTSISGNCSIYVIECIRNEPDVCVAEYFIHTTYGNLNSQPHAEDVIGPYYSPELGSMLKAFAKIFENWEQMKFVR